MTPPGKLHFINHPRYGHVYPILSFNSDKNYFKLPLVTLGIHSMVNSVFLYSTFIHQIFMPTVASFVCNPVFLAPSLYINYAMYHKYYAYFFGARSHCKNMYLLPSGKEVILETRDGESKKVKNENFYGGKRIKTRHEDRLDFSYGANTYLYLRGNYHIYDEFIFQAVIDQEFIDVNNVAYNFDVTSEFTWKFKELVQIKKRKRVYTRFYRPTARNVT